MYIYTVGTYYDNDDGDENVVLVNKRFRAFKCLESAIAYAKSVLYEWGVEDEDMMMVEKIIDERNVIHVMEKSNSGDVLWMIITETKIED